MAAQVLQSQPDKRIRLAISYGVLLTVTFLLMMPVIWMLLGSLKTDDELTGYPVQVFPAEAQWRNYEDALTIIPFGSYLANSLKLALVYSILTVITSSMAGFAFARIPARGRGKLFGIVVALLMVPYIVYVIPQFVIFTKVLGLYDTYWPWVLWGLAGSPFHIFLFRQFFAAFPKELEDAAEVDGCGSFRVYWQIFLPNAKPAIAVSFIFNFVYVWSDYLNPTIYLTSDKTTLAAALGSSYADPRGNVLMSITLAGSVLYALPLVVMFFLAQKQVMQGVVTSGLKG